MNNLRDLMSNTFAGEIAEGKHTVTFKDFKYVENENNPDNSYIAIIFNVDGKRAYKRNFFLRDTSILLSHTRRQLGRENEDIVPGVYIQELIDKQTELNIWFSYPVVATKSGPRRVQNISWMPPAEVQSEEPDFDMPPM